MRFEFSTATRIVFGRGAAREALAAARQMGTRPLLVTGRDAGRAAFLIDGGNACSVVHAIGEPTVDTVRGGVSTARDNGCDVIIAVGGGSVIDAGKAIAALLTNGPEPLDYLEVVGGGQPLTQPSAPFIAVPTTAGTGSEVTRNAVLASPAHRVKASLRGPHMLPRLAVVDPDLTLGLPPSVTASTGLDALTQLIEPWVSVRANPITDAFCLEGLPLVARSLRRACSHGDDASARVDMSLAALLSGLALANAGLGAVHGIAAPIGGMFGAPHGAVCAALLPHATAVNIDALRARAPESEALRRYQIIARILIASPRAGVEDLGPWLAALCLDLSIPPLREYGIDATHVADLVSRAARASSMKGNPVVLTEAELNGLLMRAL